MEKKMKIAVLISGNGSNLQSLIDACELSNYPAEIICVISDNAEAYGLVRAIDAGIPIYTLSPQEYSNEKEFEKELDNVLVSHEVELVCIAGFRTILTSWIIDKWLDKMINLHPSLLPKYKGADAVKRAMDAGEEKTGCTVHFVRVECDGGPLIMQKEIPLLPGESLEQVKNKVQELGHKCYPEVVKLFAEGKIGSRS